MSEVPTIPPPEAPPAAPEARETIPDAWHEAARTLAATEAALQTDVAGTWQTWLDEVRAALFVPLAETHRRLAEAHRQAIDIVLKPDEDGSLSDRWRRALTYHQRTAERVVVPLADHLAALDPSQALAEQIATLFSRLDALAQDVPDALTVPETPDLYEVGTSDSLVLSARKATVRLRRGLRRQRRVAGNVLRRLTKRTEQPPPRFGQTVPAGPLTTYHVRVRVANHLRPAYELLHRALARYVADMERLLTEWRGLTLSAERSLDHAGAHQPEFVRWPSVQFQPPDDEDRHETWSQLVAHARTLQEALDATDVAWPGDALAALADRLPALHRAYKADLERGGTFHLRLRKRPVPEAPALPDRQAWDAWHDQVRDRLALTRHLLHLRAQFVRNTEVLLNRVARATLAMAFETFLPVTERLKHAQQEAIAACDAAADADDVESLQTALSALRRKLVAYLDRQLGTVRGVVAADQVLEQPGQDEWEALYTLAEHLPEVLSVHPPVPADAPIALDPRIVRIALQEIGLDAIGAPWPEHLREAGATLRTQIVQLWSSTEQIQSIVQYNLEAALDELKALQSGDSTAAPPAADADAKADDTEEDPVARTIASCRELSSDGLRRAAETLAEMPRTIAPAWEGFVRTVYDVMQSDWDLLRTRARTDSDMDEAWMAAWRRRFARQMTRRIARLRQTSAHRLDDLRRLLRIGGRQAQRLIEKGQTAVGVAEQDAESALATLDALNGLPVVQASLPLVYRKLFSLEPVSVPSLLEGRARDLVRARQHFKRWVEDRRAPALLLALPTGSGATSMLQVIQAAAFGEVEAIFLSFDERLTEEQDVAARLADALGFTLDPPATLEDLEQVIHERARMEPPVVCLIDNLEHLLLRAPGGSALFERLLIFFSRTDRRIFWLAGINSQAWHFASRTLTTATGLVEVLAPEPLGRTDLEAVIINRHRRSGMPLRFVEPPDANAVLRQRLRRLDDPDARQALLREEYFNRLHRASGQNLLLALFYWLRSADFKAEEGVLTVNPPQPLDFRHLNRLDLPRSFSLKAFLLHHTLTLNEHNRIFRMATTQSTFIFESLLNEGIIEPVATPRAPTEPIRVVPDARYRLNRFMIHPILEHLRARHIVY